MARATTTRRMGPIGSPNWTAMLDAAEATLLEEGYGALTSRRIAERVGVKQRLVYYYFQTMDELIVETFRRMAQRELDRMRQTLAGDTPVRHLWDVCIHTTDARVTSEFIALAYRSESLRREVIHFIEESRGIQAEAVNRALAGSGAAGSRAAGSGEPAAPLDADGVALLATAIALAMTREAALGITLGHGSLQALANRFLGSIEPEGGGA